LARTESNDDTTGAAKKGDRTAPFFNFFLPVGLADLVIARTLRDVRAVVNYKQEKDLRRGSYQVQ
jgi:hypothetical protein